MTECLYLKIQSTSPSDYRLQTGLLSHLRPDVVYLSIISATDLQAVAAPCQRPSACENSALESERRCLISLETQQTPSPREVCRGEYFQIMTPPLHFMLIFLGN